MNDKGTPDGFYEIKAYTNGYVIIVEGQPPEGSSSEDPIAHNCDEMGCGLFHVVARIPVLEPTPELRWGSLDPLPPISLPQQEDNRNCQCQKLS